MDIKESILIFQKFKLYYVPIFVHVGLLGNCLSVCIFFGTKLRYSSSSIYLGALAISDIGFLVTIFVGWLDSVNVHIFTESGFCQCFIYIGQLCSFLSVWFVMVFTVERYIAVKYPLRRQSLCTVARAKMVVIGLTTLAVLLCSPVLLFAESSKKPSTNGNVTVCDLNTNWKSWAIVYNGIDTFLTFTVPLITIVIFNTLIVRNIYKFDHIRRTLTIESDERNAHNPRDKTPQIKVTKMLLLISSAFFCLNMPSSVMRMIVFLHEESLEKNHLYLAQQISSLLFNMSFGINFFLYCASGDNFRKAMVHMFINRSSTRRSGTLIQMTSNGKQYVSEFTRKWNSKKQSDTSVNNERPRDSQIDQEEMQKFQINEEL